MSKKKTTKKKDHLFKKGNTIGKKGGRPRTSPEMKAIKRLTRTAFEEIANKFLYLPVEQLKDMVDSKRQNMEGMTVLEGMIARLLRDSLVVGNVNTLIFFLERLVSKKRSEQNFIVAVPTVSEMTNEMLKTAKIEIYRLQEKSQSEGLDSEETRNLVHLSKLVSDMVDKSASISDNDPRKLSDAELIKKAAEAKKVVMSNLKNETKH